MSLESARRRRLGPRDMEEQLGRLGAAFRRDFVDAAASGALLPSVNDLAERYGVSFAVARKFYERQQADGVVRAEPRKGFFLDAPGRFQQPLPPRRALLIGLVGYVDHTHPHAPFCHSALILQTLEKEANQHGWRVRFFNTCPENTLSDGMLLEMAKARLDAVFLVVSCKRDADVAALRRLDIPLLVTEEPCEGATCVTYDNKQLGILATTHLLESGHREIACVEHLAPHSWAVGREAGFHEALGRKGLVFRTDKDDPEACRGCVQELRRRGVTAVFCVNDQLSLALLRAGLVPGEIAVIGVDDTLEARSYDLSTVQKADDALGEAAFNVLVDYFDNGVPLPPEVALRGVLLKRGSTARTLVA